MSKTEARGHSTDRRKR